MEEVLAAEELQVAGKILTEQQTKELESLITQIETKTFGEIKVVIADRSSTISHVPIVIFLFSFVLLALIDIPHLQATLTGEIWWPLGAWPLLSLVFARILSRYSWAQRTFTPKLDRLRQVESRAELEFYRQKMRATSHQTGVLLYVSLMEHVGVVLGDEEINKQVRQADWDQVIKDLIEDTRKQGLFQGLKHALVDIGDLLVRHLPLPPDQKNLNQLSNHIIFYEED